MYLICIKRIFCFLFPVTHLVTDNTRGIKGSYILIRKSYIHTHAHARAHTHTHTHTHTHLHNPVQLFGQLSVAGLIENARRYNETCSVFVFFLLGDSPVSEFCVPTFRNTLFHIHSLHHQRRWNSVPKRRHIKFRRQGVAQQHPEDGGSLKSRIFCVLASIHGKCKNCEEFKQLRLNESSNLIHNVME
jgi:hypothetical protein